MLTRIALAHRVNAYVLGFVMIMTLVLTLTLLMGVALFAAGQPRLLFSLVAAFAIVSPFLSVPLRLLSSARAFDERLERLTRVRGRVSTRG